MILVTGVSGTVGGAVLRELLSAGEPLRALYRSAKEAAAAPPGVQAAVADFADNATLAPALAGVDSIYLVCSPIPDLIKLESNVIAACAEAGVGHVVLNSALGAEDWPKSFPSWHRRVEDVLKASGLAYTILRPNGFLQNITTYYAPSIRTGGVFYSSTGDAKTSFVDVRDIAALAAKILLVPSAHAGRTYEINGPEAFNNSEVAAAITRVTGHPAQYEDIPEAAQREAMLGMGMPDWQVTALLELQQYYLTGGGAHTDSFMAGLLGRPLLTLDTFLAESEASFRPEAGAAKTAS